jgi:hypothetical protein
VAAVPALADAGLHSDEAGQLLGDLVRGGGDPAAAHAVPAAGVCGLLLEAAVSSVAVWWMVVVVVVNVLSGAMSKIISEQLARDLPNLLHALGRVNATHETFLLQRLDHRQRLALKHFEAATQEERACVTEVSARQCRPLCDGLQVVIRPPRRFATLKQPAAVKLRDGC